MNPDSHPILKIGASGEDHPTFAVNGIEIYLPGSPQFRSAVGTVLLLASIYSFIWIVWDARRRGKSGFLAFCFACAATWPFSILWWVWLRPEIEKPLAPPAPSPLPPKIP